jgi:uncharacterized protein (DUF58 family)
MIQPRTRTGDDGGNRPARAHVAIEDLVRLQHRSHGFSLLPHQPVHSILTGRHASRLRGRGLNFEELRHYWQGDDIRTMDWLATARLRSPHVRVYSEERDRPVLLIVDQRMSMFFGSRGAMKSVIAAEVAALAAWRVTGSGDRVGAIVFDDAEVVEIRPQSRRRGALRILGTVARLNQALSVETRAASQPGMLNEALRHAERLATHDWLVCLVTDAAGADAETVQLVTRLTAHNDVMTAFIYDPLEEDLPDLGRVAVEDGGRQIFVDTARTRLRRDFADAFSTRLEAVERFSRSRTIPVMRIRTDRDPAAQIRAILGQRLSAGRRQAQAAR